MRWGEKRPENAVASPYNMDRVEPIDKSKIPNQDDEKHKGPKNNNWRPTIEEESSTSTLLLVVELISSITNIN